MDNAWWVGEDELNDEQKKIVALPLGQSHLVLGPPGSGKTNLLLLRANFEFLSGNADIHILVFTRTLQEFIAAGGREYNFPASKVSTFHGWARNILYQYGIEEQPTGSFYDQRNFYIEKLKDLIDIKGLSNICDVIFLDEAHDCLPEEVEIFSTLACFLFASADSRQKIYKGTDSVSTLKTIISNVHVLKYHYRNGFSICKLADGISKKQSARALLLPTSNYDEVGRPSTVEYCRFENSEQQAEKIIDKLKIQLLAYPNELLGVVCPTNEDVDYVYDVLSRSELSSYCLLQKSGSHSPFGSNKLICVSTIHAAKGLEFRALHMASCESLKRMPFPRNLTYTAVTRAKTSLSVYYTNDVHGFFENALNSLEKKPDIPSLKDVFKGKEV